MPKKFSIAEARDHLSRLVHQAEEEGPIELTRRGQSVAVVLSLEGYRRLEKPKPDLYEVLSDLRSKLGLESLEIDPDEIFGEARSRDSGRDVSW